MSLVNLRRVSIHYGTHLHINEINLTLNPNERVALIGRNGAGKSTLLKLINRDIKPDSGDVEFQKNLNVTLLSQEVPENQTGSIYDVVASSIEKQAALLSRYHHLILAVTNHADANLLNQLSDCQTQLEMNGGFTYQQRIDQVISLLELPPDIEFASLSGGMKRRVELAKALVRDPDLLLLDEPTNHLDIDHITWLETFLLRFNGSILFVTHDRSFLKNVATRIIDLDRGNLTSWPGNYQTYLTRKEDQLHAEELAWARFDRKLAEEEVWIRQGIKARRTRNEGRVKSLEKMREVSRQRKKRIGNVDLKTQDAATQSSKIVITADNVSFQYEQETLVKSFSTIIMRGDKIGLIGANGSGKTTLLRILLGELKPTEGSITHGAQLQIAYYDQLRTQLEDDKNILDNVAEGSSAVTVNGKSKHIMSYLQDFLFTGERAYTPVGSLSGGERNRVALAKLFLKPSNVLVLDEPTNDLDMETLDLLEEWLVDYPGTLLLVSHDRTFLNNVVTSTLVFTGKGKIEEFVGGYDDSVEQRLTSKAKTTPPPVTKPSIAKTTTTDNKLSSKERQELSKLPKQIEKLEQEIELLQQPMSSPDFYQQDAAKITQHNNQLKQLKTQLDTFYKRWEELEGR